MGTTHGGIFCDLADAAMGMAWASTLDEGEAFTTLELKINFLKPVWAGTLVATGDHRVRLRQIGVAGFQAATLEQPLLPRGDPRERDADLFMHWRR